MNSCALFLIINHVYYSAKKKSTMCGDKDQQAPQLCLQQELMSSGFLCFFGRSKDEKDVQSSKRGSNHNFAQTVIKSKNTMYATVLTSIIMLFLVCPNPNSLFLLRLTEMADCFEPQSPFNILSMEVERRDSDQWVHCRTGNHLLPCVTCSVVYDHSHGVFTLKVLSSVLRGLITYKVNAKMQIHVNSLRAVRKTLVVTFAGSLEFRFFNLREIFELE